MIDDVADQPRHLKPVEQATVSYDLPATDASGSPHQHLPPGSAVQAIVDPLVAALAEANQEVGRLRAESDPARQQVNAKDAVIAELRLQLESGQLRQRHLEDVVQAARARIDQLQTDPGQRSVQDVESTFHTRSALLPLPLSIKQLRVGPLDASMLIWVAGLVCIVVARFIFQLATELVFVAALAVLLLSVAVRRYTDQAG